LSNTPWGYMFVGMDHMSQTHEHQGHAGSTGSTGSSWRVAISATLHCLTGCAIGEVLGMVLATWWGWSTVPSVALAVVLAFFFGYLLTITSVRRAGLAWPQAIRVALAADTISILVMEVVDNAVMVGVPGAMGAGLVNWVFWAALAFSLLVAFVVTVPVNRAMIARGRGHAVVHEYHH
jgi:Domain of unknown function (DUF4396)